jgi:hypothetical protein
VERGATEAEELDDPIQKRALAEGSPHQTLDSNLLHKYASGA